MDDETEWLASRFEEQRPRLRAVAYRMLGSVAEAEDAVQDAWLRLSRAEATEIDNLGGWLTTVVARESLHRLRSRRRRREDLVDTSAGPLPDPVISATDDVDPEHQVVLAETVGLALLVVLDSLTPAERLAFVLHDMFDLPFDEIAPLVDRSPVAARQLASRARRRVRGVELPAPDQDPTRQRRVVDAFYAAANTGDFESLVELLHPDVVFRADYGAARPPALYRGAATVARQARRARGADLEPVLINGLPGVIAFRDGRPVSIMAFTIANGLILEIDGIRDPHRLQQLVPHHQLLPSRPPLSTPTAPPPARTTHHQPTRPRHPPADPPPPPPLPPTDPPSAGTKQQQLTHRRHHQPPSQPAPSAGTRRGATPDLTPPRSPGRGGAQSHLPHPTCHTPPASPRLVQRSPQRRVCAAAPTIHP